MAPRWFSKRPLEDFMAFASHAEYLKGIGHRTAALEDSRLLPLAEMQSEFGSPS